MFVYLFPVAVVVVDADEGACEGENFAESDEDSGVYLTCGGQGYSCCEQCAPESAHCSGKQELYALHHAISSEHRCQTY